MENRKLLAGLFLAILLVYTQAQTTGDACPSLGLSNGEISFSYSNQHDSTASHSCDDGYILRGDESRECQSDGTWSGTEPTCQRGCSSPGNINDGTHADLKKTFGVGELLTYECRPGYTFSVPGSPDTRECLSSFTWSEPLFTCTEQDCRYPDAPRYGGVNAESTLYRSSATYYCNTGYNISGDASRECTTTTDENVVEWSGQVPMCEAIVCPDFGDLANGVIDDGGIDSYTYSTSLFINCNKGFKLSKKSLAPVTCSLSGTWSEFPTCIVDYDCDFEESSPQTYCAYTAERWERTLIADHHTGGFNYVARATGSSGAVLSSPNYAIGAQGACLTFYYRILESSVANFSVMQQGSDGSSYTLFEDREVTAWKSIRLNLKGSGTTGWKFQVSPEAAFIELDDITLQESGCPKPTLQPVSITDEPNPPTDPVPPSTGSAIATTAASTPLAMETSAGF